MNALQTASGVGRNSGGSQCRCVAIHHNAARAITEAMLSAAVGPSPGMRHARTGLTRLSGSGADDDDATGESFTVTPDEARGTWLSESFDTVTRAPLPVRADAGASPTAHATR